MKNYIHRFSVLCLVLALCLCTIPLAGCGKVSFKEPLTAYVFTTRDGLTDETLRVETPLTEEEQARLLRYLEGKTWQAGTPKSLSDYELKNETVTLNYYSESGVISDTKKSRSFTLSEEERLAVNELLHVNVPKTPIPPLDTSGDSVTIYHRSYGLNIIAKKVYGPLATALIGALSSATETGEIEPSPHDDEAVLPPDITNAPNKMLDTYWILVGDVLYRYDESLCRVERYAGEGKILEQPDGIETMLTDLWAYYPLNFYKGVYRVPTKELTMTHAFEAVSTVQFEVQELTIGEEKGAPCTLILTLDSDVEQIVSLGFQYSNGADVLICLESANVYLNGTDPSTVRIDFGADPIHGYEIELIMGQTKAQIYVSKK